MQKLPADYPEMGWVMYKSGKCTYKRSYHDCPRKEHWHRHEDDWDWEYGVSPRPLAAAKQWQMQLHVFAV